MRKQGARVSPRPVRAGGEGPVLAATPGSDHGRQTDGGRAKRPQLATKVSGSEKCAPCEQYL